MAAPVGNKNAAKGNKWKTAIEHVLENYETDQVRKGLALREIARKLIDTALEGDMQAIKEIGDRLDGKPVQAVTGEGGGPLTIEIVRFAGKDSE